MSAALEDAIVAVEAELEETLRQLEIAAGDRFRFVAGAWGDAEKVALNQIVALHARHRRQRWERRAIEIDGTMEDIRRELKELREWRARGL